MSAPESPKGLADLPAAPQAPIPVEEWLKLNPRMIVVRPLHELVRVIPALIVIVIAGGHDTQRLWWTLGAIGLVIAHGVLHWFTTRYRVTDSQVELHTGVIFRQRLAVRRDRIRTVETTAKFGHRMFGLAEVRIGTGQHEQKKKGPLSLDAVAVSEANRLRRYLLQRSAPPNTAATGTEAPGPTTAGQGGTGTPRSRTLARLDWHWLRFAPLTLSGVAVVGAAVGFGFKIINDLNIAPDSVGPLRELLRWSGQRPIVIIALLALAVFVVLVVLFSVIGYVFGYAGFRLDRREDGTLHVSRGLLTTRSVTIEEAKLRGVLLREELLLRCGKGARLSAVTTGLDRKNDSSLLLPPAPRARAHAVAALALNATAETPTSASLARHPRGALQRRLTRTLVPAVGVILLLLILALSHQIPHWIW
ncbi:MAG: PH domain-containing protein, partial [Sciscionella sp.]